MFKFCQRCSTPRLFLATQISAVHLHSDASPIITSPCPCTAFQRRRCFAAALLFLSFRCPALPLLHLSTPRRFFACHSDTCPFYSLAFLVTSRLRSSIASQLYSGLRNSFALHGSAMRLRCITDLNLSVPFLCSSRPVRYSHYHSVAMSCLTVRTAAILSFVSRIFFSYSEISFRSFTRSPSRASGPLLTADSAQVATQGFV